MDIAFCVNRLGLIGLGATVCSLIRNCSKQENLNIWFFCTNLSLKDKLKLEDLLRLEKYKGEFNFIDFDALTLFGGFNSLHGDWTAYGRLIISDYIEADRVLYLDSDLIVELDVLQLEDFEFGEHILAAVGGGEFGFALGNQFYVTQIGLSPKLEYFNSGVLLLNLIEWRAKDIKERCFEIARQHQLNLPSHDQSILNIYCKGNFAHLPLSFNCQWIAGYPKPNISDKMILHFVGSPKPWDPLGFIIHKGYKTWMQYNAKNWNTINNNLSVENLLRFWHIRNSYMRTLIHRIMG